MEHSSSWVQFWELTAARSSKERKDELFDRTNKWILPHGCTSFHIAHSEKAYLAQNNDSE
jgi:hypothetical protein